MKYHGLHIGIDYARTPNALSKCISDAKQTRASFAPDCASSRSLLEAEATKAGIVQAILQLWTTGAPGDMAIISYSGHGTRKPRRDGGERDGYDEAFVPYDYRNGELLLDDELAVLLSRRPPGKPVLLITDCCHSGTIARNLSGNDERPRYLPFSAIVNELTPGRAERLMSHSPRASRPEDATAGVVHISGCRDDEYSYENQNGGLLTQYLLATKANLSKGATLGEWYQRIAINFPMPKYPQNPQFNAGEVEANWYVPGFAPVVDEQPDETPPNVTVEVGGWRSKRIEWERVP